MNPAGNLDVENRVTKATVELLKADSALSSVVASRIYKYGDQTHKAVYPCVTVQIVNCLPFGFREGWYRVTANLIAESYIHDDKDGAVLFQVAGRLRGIFQSKDSAAALNGTASARAAETALTSVEIELVDSYEENDRTNIRANAIVVAVVCRPSIGKNNG